MKKYALLVLTLTGLTLSAGPAAAGWGTHHYGGHHPHWAFWTRHHKRYGSEEERWQKFWHDYYDALQHYYDRLEHIDWVAYYKFHGYQINGGGMGAPYGCAPYGYGCQYRPQFAPVFVSPTMQWATPNGGGMACPPSFGGVPGY